MIFGILCEKAKCNPSHQELSSTAKMGNLLFTSSYNCFQIFQNVVMNGKIDIIEACLKHGGDINRSTECHGSLLHAVDISSERYFHVLEHLLKNGKYLSFHVK